MSAIRVLITLTICLLANIPHALAEKSEYVIATQEYPPYISQQDDANNYLFEVMDEIAKEMDVSFKLSFLPWKRVTNNVEKGQAFAAFPLALTSAREQKFLYSDPLYTAKVKFFYFAPRGTKPNIQVNKLSDLHKVKIGGVIGYYYDYMFKKAGIKPELVPNERQNIQRLALGRIDLIPMNEITGWHLIREMFPPEQVKLFGTLKKPFISANSNHLIVSRNNPEAAQFIERFNAALSRVKESGRYQQILDRRGLNIPYRKSGEK